MPQSTPVNAEAIVAEVLSYLAAHEPMLTRFFNLTGLTPETIREASTDPGFYASVLDHLLADEILLAQFTQPCGLRPEDVRLARHRLDESDETKRQAEKAAERSALTRKPSFR
ncbi:DUF3572 domain-containing protein [Microvirga vignae]|uniref:DUF3572 domain-containing protein n=1 Tax=Microvirga vignae TaxID=1225564 RepID=UPI000699C522|nr:DUF3572 domain-containing protein [Microvirga vignae]